MSPIVGERDLLIMGTSPRFMVSVADKVLLLTPSAWAFPVNKSGSSELGEILITADPVNIVGAVEFTASAGVPLSAVGKVATLRFQDMSVNTAFISARVLDEQSGVAFTRSVVISKTFDGKDGNPGGAGAPGQRGTVAVAARGYSVWSDASAVYELSAAGYGAPINRDVVTLFDDTHAVSKFYSNGEWLLVGTVVDGNLLVNGTVAAEKMDVDELSAISGNFGRMVAGDITGVVLHGGPGYEHSTYSWPTNGQGGYHLSAEGLLFGAPASGRYYQVTAGGDVYAPNFSIVNGRANFGGNVNTGAGTSFRIEMGPDDPVYAMWAGSGAKTDANAIFYLKRSGAGYFGGSLSAGMLRTAVTNPTLDANAQLVDGPFGTNGSPITVVCSYAYNDSGEASGGMYAASGADNTATIQLYRTIAGGGETLVQTVTASGNTTINNAPAGSGEFSRYQHQMSASFTITDSAGGSQNRTYRAVLSKRSLKAIQFTANPGESGNVRPQATSQTLTIITTE